MYISHLRAVGGSVMFAIPKPILDAMNLKADQAIGLRIEDGKIMFEPTIEPPTRKRRSKYRLEDLLAQCDPNIPRTEEDDTWDKMRPVGDELV
jgi:antitoxin ChpS